MNSQQARVVAVDGPSGTGKSTVSKRLATALGAAYLDTGAMYRAATLAALRSGVDLTDAEAVTTAVHHAKLDFGTTPADPYSRLDGAPVDAEIRGPEVTKAVSAVAGIPAVRAHLIAEQRRIIAEAAGGIVVEGRDIGEVVAPDADLKIYLTADERERARRRSAEDNSDITATAADLARRDAADAKTTKPHEAAPGAVILDTTGLGIEEVVDRMRELLDNSNGEASD
ncbi:(d)CMP kinase [Phytomonospora sp. NPDC050363]|uniref:(d)CMP kinase n=1 Tax=Phytomonospora sp. NPDC050363 TaxID=3155642 RepID=UPI0033FE702F